jgi:hypothetical protein
VAPGPGIQRIQRASISPSSRHPLPLPLVDSLDSTHPVSLPKELEHLEPSNTCVRILFLKSERVVALLGSDEALSSSSSFLSTSRLRTLSFNLPAYNIVDLHPGSRRLSPVPPSRCEDIRCDRGGFLQRKSRQNGDVSRVWCVTFRGLSSARSGSASTSCLDAGH